MVESSLAQKAKSANQASSLEDLGLAIGDALIIETVAGNRRLSSRLIGYVKGRSILVESPHFENKEVKLEQSQTVTIRGMVGNQAYAFSSKVVYCSVQPFRHYYLEFPSETVSVEIRKNSRVTVDLPILVESEFDIGLGDWPKAAIIQDISPHGAGLLTRQMLGEKNHEITLRFNIEIGEIQKALKIPAIIRNYVVVDKPSGSHYIFGTEFSLLDDETRLALTGFLYETQSR